MTPAQRGDLGHQLLGFVLRDEERRLHRVHENFELRQLKAPVGDPVAILVASELAHDFKSLGPKRLHILAHRAPLAGDAHLAQTLANLAGGDRVVLVRLLPQKLHELEQHPL